MEVPLLLCALIALTSGLHFGHRFTETRRAGRMPLLPVAAHGVVSGALIILAMLLDASSVRVVWVAVTVTSVTGLAIGALWAARHPEPVPTDGPLPAPDPARSAT
ncbi:hypothetical protein LAJ19_01025 [Deinococcus taeanensis]|uniref:hypothetical protein n=1 Tax=Deinococcus taeanensis TaxID=2737050 RepID=UPI001CDC2122|nr:hypothetical protein [Deinococcus taeanensis]UBV42843.1 hypothetical protein LAJ19_01025 [Deinococcus taeanensis]